MRNEPSIPPYSLIRILFAISKNNTVLRKTQNMQEVMAEVCLDSYKVDLDQINVDKRNFMLSRFTAILQSQNC